VLCVGLPLLDSFIYGSIYCCILSICLWIVPFRITPLFTWTTFCILLHFTCYTDTHSPTPTSPYYHYTCSFTYLFLHSADYNPSPHGCLQHHNFLALLWLRSLHTGSSCYLITCPYSGRCLLLCRLPALFITHCRLVLPHHRSRFNIFAFAITFTTCTYAVRRMFKYLLAFCGHSSPHFTYHPRLAAFSLYSYVRLVERHCTGIYLLCHCLYSSVVAQQLFLLYSGHWLCLRTLPACWTDATCLTRCYYLVPVILPFGLDLPSLLVHTFGHAHMRYTDLHVYVPTTHTPPSSYLPVIYALYILHACVLLNLLVCTHTLAFYIPICMDYSCAQWILCAFPYATPHVTTFWPLLHLICCVPGLCSPAFPPPLTCLPLYPQHSYIACTWFYHLVVRLLAIILFLYLQFGWLFHTLLPYGSHLQHTLLTLHTQHSPLFYLFVTTLVHYSCPLPPHLPFCGYSVIHYLFTIPILPTSWFLDSSLFWIYFVFYYLHFVFGSVARTFFLHIHCLFIFMVCRSSAAFAIHIHYIVWILYLPFIGFWTLHTPCGLLFILFMPYTAITFVLDFHSSLQTFGHGLYLFHYGPTALYSGLHALQLLFCLCPVLHCRIAIFWTRSCAAGCLLPLHTALLWTACTTLFCHAITFVLHCTLHFCLPHLTLILPFATLVPTWCLLLPQILLWVIVDVLLGFTWCYYCILHALHCIVYVVYPHRCMDLLFYTTCLVPSTRTHTHFLTDLCLYHTAWTVAVHAIHLCCTQLDLPFTFAGPSPVHYTYCAYLVQLFDSVPITFPRSWCHTDLIYLLCSLFCTLHTCLALLPYSCIYCSYTCIIVCPVMQFLPGFCYLLFYCILGSCEHGLFYVFGSHLHYIGICLYTFSLVYCYIWHCTVFISTFIYCLTVDYLTFPLFVPARFLPVHYRLPLYGCYTPLLDLQFWMRHIYSQRLLPHCSLPTFPHYLTLFTYCYLFTIAPPVLFAFTVTHCHTPHIAPSCAYTYLCHYRLVVHYLRITLLHSHCCYLGYFVPCPLPLVPAVFLDLVLLYCAPFIVVYLCHRLAHYLPLGFCPRQPVFHQLCPSSIAVVGPAFAVGFMHLDNYTCGHRTPYTFITHLACAIYISWIVVCACAPCFHPHTTAFSTIHYIVTTYTLPWLWILDLFVVFLPLLTCYHLTCLLGSQLYSCVLTTCVPV